MLHLSLIFVSRIYLFRASISSSFTVTSSWDKASLYALWTGVSSGTGLFP